MNNAIDRVKQFGNEFLPKNRAFDKVKRRKRAVYIELLRDSAIGKVIKYGDLRAAPIGKQLGHER